jgi:GrpB-like predicted nucleotidyltransferase (UPF0157 family)
MEPLSQTTTIIEKYISGEASVEEIALLQRALADNPEMLKKLQTLRRSFEEEDASGTSPVESTAGFSE